MKRHIISFIGGMLFLCSGCASLIETGETQIGNAVRLLFAPAKILINEGKDLFRDEDFRLSHGDTLIEYPDENLEESVYEMTITGVDAVGRIVKVHAVAEVRNPEHLSKLHREAVTPIITEAECPDVRPCPEDPPPPVSAQDRCLQNPKLTALSLWLEAVGRGGFVLCQPMQDEVTGQTYVLDVVYSPQQCVVTLEHGTNAEVWAKHDTIRVQGYQVVPLYPHDFLNTISGSQQSSLSQIDACLAGDGL